ncbi:MAG: acyl-CoA desaturase, partial [Planctomycetota bacterium]
GRLTGGSAAQMAASWFVWGVAVRTVAVLHGTWSVNSLSHLFGYRNYETRDHSTNNWLVALITHGEGWHNNHHAQPRAAAHGHRWWELDMSWWVIWTLEKVGLAKDVVRPRRKVRT